jgi:hypothetical protein
LSFSNLGARKPGSTSESFGSHRIRPPCHARPLGEGFRTVRLSLHRTRQGNGASAPGIRFGVITHSPLESLSYPVGEIPQKRFHPKKISRPAEKNLAPPKIFCGPEVNAHCPAATPRTIPQH